MKRLVLLSLCLLFVAGCALSGAGTSTPTKIPTAPPKATFTPTPTLNAQAAPATPTPTPDLTPQPGLLVEGYVRLADGTGLGDVKIYRAFSAYPGDEVAITDQDGYYQSDFVYIPGDEMVRVWAEREGYDFEPAALARDWANGAYSWRHYYGREKAELNFIAKPAP